MANAAEDEILPSLECLFESKLDAICPFGDIVLVAQDDFLPTSKSQVSSCILAMSSKVFTAMFSNNFSEGQRMRSRKPGELLEIHTTDSPLAMKHLLRLLHHADPLDDGEKILSSPAMLDLAMIIDKYDCIEALRLPINALLARYSVSEDCALDHLSTAAFILDQPEHFRTFTQRLVATKVMVQAKHFDQRCLGLLPSSLLPSLFCQQSIARQEITTQITRFIEKYSKACKIAGRETLIVDLLDELHTQRLWPLENDYSLKCLYKRMKNITIPVVSIDDKIETSVRSPWKQEGSDYSWSSPIRNRKDSWRDIMNVDYINAPQHSDLKRMASSVKSLVVGVCIDCIQQAECRNPHR